MPMHARLSFSLGATAGPPNTWRGTTLTTAVAEAVALGLALDDEALIRRQAVEIDLIQILPAIDHIGQSGPVIVVARH